MSAGKSVLWTAADAAAACAVPCEASFEATGVSIDSRTLTAGDLFVAVKGANFDGHDFVAEALANGAAGAVVERPPVGSAAPLIVVADTQAALTALGRAGRARAAARIVAVTGSVGKTGTKDALKLVLGRQGRTSANHGSLNNHLGVPLSLARLAPDADWGVFEMGMNHAGEITPLSRLARPHVAVVTTVEAVHGAFFDSVEAIADAKAEVFAGMAADGTAILNRDNPHFRRLAARAAERRLAVIGFGRDAAAEARLIEARPEADASEVVAAIAGTTYAYRIGVPGCHWVTNSLAVLAAAAALGADVAAAAAALAAMTAPQGRGRRHTVAVSGGAFEVIDESYNASPVSMAAAFQVLGRTRPGAGGRRIAVLGDMLELGAQAPDLHRGLAAELGDSPIELVFTAGPLMSFLWEALPARLRGGHAADCDTLAPLVAAALRPGDVVTVKGSAGSRTGVVVHALLARGGAAAPRRAANEE